MSECGGDHLPVRLVDLTGRKRSAGRAQLAPGCKHGHARTTSAANLGNSRRSERADLGGSEPRPCVRNQVSGADIATTAAYVRTNVRSLGDLDVPAAFYGVFDRHD